MALDITTLTGQGITKWEAQEIEYPSNPRNEFKYKIKFLEFRFSTLHRYAIGYFSVQRLVEQNGDYVNDISYTYESIASDTFCDKLGNIVEENDPLKWGTEFERMQVLFNAPIADSQIVESYQQELFDKGLFDFPKRREID